MITKKNFWIGSVVTLIILGTTASALYHTELGNLISQKSCYDASDSTFTTEKTYKKSNLIQNEDGSSVVYEEGFGFLISSSTRSDVKNVPITESLYSKEQLSNETDPNIFLKISEIYDENETLLVRSEVSAVFDRTQLPATVSDLSANIRYIVDGCTVSDGNFSEPNEGSVTYHFTLSHQDTSNLYSVQISSDPDGIIS